MSRCGLIGCSILVLVGSGVGLTSASRAADSDQGTSASPPKRRVLPGPNPEAFMRLEQKMGEAYRRGDYEAALSLAQQMLEVALPNARGPVHYNIACLHALLGHKDEAFEALDRSVAAGMTDVSVYQRDPDLASLHDDPRWAALLGRLRELHETVAIDPNAQTVRTYVPPGLPPDRPAPALVVLHPYGGNAEAFLAHWKAASDDLGLVVIAPESPRVVSAEGFRWGSIAETEAIVQAAIERTAKEHPIDTSRIVLAGFSQGGQRALDVGLRHPERFAGIVAIAAAGLHTIPPPKAPQGGGPRILLLVGQADRPEILRGNEQALLELKKAGYTVAGKMYPDLGHALPPNTEAELTGALRWILQPPP